MNETLSKIKTEVYDKFEFKILDFKHELESREYDATRFKLNDTTIICRTAKVTPKKVGQFVTFWKRIENGPIQPFEETDHFDYFVINVKTKNRLGQFVFPKFVLIQKGIISTRKKEGKRALRVYPSWDTPKSKQAEQTQNWQLNYFYEITNSIEFSTVRELYGIS